MRKVKEIKIENDNRDRGKRFRITEMSAMAQERWATKAVCALLNSGLALPEGMTAEDLQGASGLAKILSMGLKPFQISNMNWPSRFMPSFCNAVNIWEHKVKQ